MPHGWHCWPSPQVVKGAVQPTSLSQQGSPRRPQASQPPAVQVPAPPEQLPPAATQVGVFWALWSQQPPAAQTFPSQHGWSASPQGSHSVVSGLHTSPEAVHTQAPVKPVAQQVWPCPPHWPAPLQLPSVHVPRKPPQLPPVATQLPPAQQLVAVVQEVLAQHGCVSAPHATKVPAAHTVPPVPSSPDATQRLLVVSQHPPPAQMEPAQQASPGRPHTRHWPAVQVPPVEQSAASAMHSSMPVSQQPEEQALAAQHGRPGVPQGLHRF